MPIYEYTCKSCEAKFDQLVRSMSANADAAKCPKCGSEKTARAMSVFAVSSEGGKSSGSDSSLFSDTPACGRCGGMPGSCQMG